MTALIIIDQKKKKGNKCPTLVEVLSQLREVHSITFCGGFKNHVYDDIFCPKVSKNTVLQNNMYTISTTMFKEKSQENIEEKNNQHVNNSCFFSRREDYGDYFPFHLFMPSVLSKYSKIRMTSLHLIIY